MPGINSDHGALHDLKKHKLVQRVGASFLFFFFFFFFVFWRESMCKLGRAEGERERGRGRETEREGERGREEENLKQATCSAQRLTRAEIKSQMLNQLSHPGVSSF